MDHYNEWIIYNSAQQSGVKVGGTRRSAVWFLTITLSLSVCTCEIVLSHLPITPTFYISHQMHNSVQRGRKITFYTKNVGETPHPWELAWCPASPERVLGTVFLSDVSWRHWER